MPSWCSGTWNSLKTFVNRNFYEPFGLRLEGGKISICIYVNIPCCFLSSSNFQSPLFTKGDFSFTYKDERKSG